MAAPLPKEISSMEILSTEYDGTELFISFSGMAFRVEPLEEDKINLLNFIGSVTVPANLEDGWYYTDYSHLSISLPKAPADVPFGVRHDYIKDGLNVHSFNFNEKVHIQVDQGFVKLWLSNDNATIFGYSGQLINTAGKNTIKHNTHFYTSPSNSGITIADYEFEPGPPVVG